MQDAVASSRLAINIPLLVRRATCTAIGWDPRCGPTVWPLAKELGTVTVLVRCLVAHCFRGRWGWSLKAPGTEPPAQLALVGKFCRVACRSLAAAGAPAPAAAGVR